MGRFSNHLFYGGVYLSDLQAIVARQLKYKPFYDLSRRTVFFKYNCRKNIPAYNL